MLFDEITKPTTIREHVTMTAENLGIINDIDDDIVQEYQVFIGSYNSNKHRLDVIDIPDSILEASFTTVDLGYDKNEVTPRLIFIGRDADAKHKGSARMKVSAPIDLSNPGKGKRSKQYLSFYNAGKEIRTKGDKDEFSSEEIDFYKALLSRNEILLKIATDPNNEDLARDAIINDENLRNSGNIVVRDEYGHAMIYKNNKSKVPMYSLYFER